MCALCASARGGGKGEIGCAHTTLISWPFSDASKKPSSVYVCAIINRPRIFRARTMDFLEDRIQVGRWAMKNIVRSKYDLSSPFLKIYNVSFYHIAINRSAQKAIYHLGIHSLLFLLVFFIQSHFREDKIKMSRKNLYEIKRRDDRHEYRRCRER